jgi:phage terminase large subunit GpA-like protein
LDQAEGLAFSKSKKKIPILDWAKGIVLGARPFQIEGYEYQVDMLTCDAPKQCYKKGAQMGVTEINVFKSMHGLIHSKYPQGVLYLFPTALDVSDFLKGRFQTLIRDNPKEVGAFVQDTDAVSIKRVRKAMLYLRGARSTTKIEGIKKSSSQLKGVPVDRDVFDECDEMEPTMIDIARERLSHSEIKEESYLSTPSIPDYGIDKLFQGSDQRIRMIRCEHCGTETCLELEFPECLLETVTGKVIRVCKKCKQEIFPRNGRWVPQYPERSKNMVGWWISQLKTVSMLIPEPF